MADLEIIFMRIEASNLKFALLLSQVLHESSSQYSEHVPESNMQMVQLYSRYFQVFMQYFSSV